MTREELIKGMIDARKNGEEDPVNYYCNNFQLCKNFPYEQTATPGCDVCPYKFHYHEIIDDLVARILADKKELEQRRTGKWITDNDMPKCSECGYIPEYNEHIDDFYYSDYCPNCGTRMEGVKE